MNTDRVPGAGRRGRALRLASAVGLLILLASALLILAPLAASPSSDEGRRSARLLGEALTSGRASLIRPILPEAGRVYVALSWLGVEPGHYGSSQVEALFADFLAQGAVKSFEVLRVESDGQTYCVARGRAALTDRRGRPARVGIHLAFQAQDGRWVLAEIKDASE